MRPDLTEDLFEQLKRDLTIFHSIPDNEKEWTLNTTEIRAVQTLLQFSQSLHEQHTAFVAGHLTLVRELGRKARPNI